MGQRDHFVDLHLQVRDQGSGLLWLPVCLSKENTIPSEHLRELSFK